MSPHGPGKLAGTPHTPPTRAPGTTASVLRSTHVPPPPFSLPHAGHKLCRECPGHCHHRSGTELAKLLEDPGCFRQRRKQVSQPMQASQGGASGFKLTAEEQRLSQRASSQKDRSLQSDARQASQASSSQVFVFHKSFLHFHHLLFEKEASDTMLVATTGCTDAFWRPSA